MQAGSRMMGMGNIGSMLKEGTKHLQGVDEATARNIEAVKGLMEITRTSMGPNGMNKMVINHLEKLFVTADAATIVKELEVEHPAAKMVVLASQMQEQEIGDGTNLVIVFAGELMSQAEGLLRMGLHVSDIVAGYQRAADKALEICQSLACHTTADPRDVKAVARDIRSAIASKAYGNDAFLADLVARACIQILPSDPTKFNTDNIRVCKVLGGSLLSSTVIRGFALNRPAEGSIKHVKVARVAVFASRVDTAQTETKGTVLIKNANDLVNYNLSEEKKIEEIIKSIADTGVNVIVSGSGFGEMAMHFIEKYKMLAFKCLSKFDLRRLCRAVGATALVRLGAPTPEEIGYADTVDTMEIGSDKVTVFVNEKEESKISTVLVRSSTLNLLDNIERTIDDGVNVFKALTKQPEWVAGAAASEIEIARQISTFAATLPGLDQYAVRKFGEAFEIIPRTLAENAGQDGAVVIANLYAAHANGNTNTGVNIEEPGTVDAKEAGVFDLLATKMSAIRLATEAAVTVLKVDSIIMSKPAGGPKPKGPGGQDGDDD